MKGKQHGPLFGLARPTLVTFQHPLRLVYLTTADIRNDNIMHSDTLPHR